ncbi:MAG: urea ABC transporter permease subunit UrtB, partial [Rhodocyclaceae bacterium]
MRRFAFLILGWLLAAACARAAVDPALLKPLAVDDSDTRLAAIAALVETAPDAALPVLKALAEDSLALAGERVV